jgi:hypothetical protein
VAGRGGNHGGVGPGEAEEGGEEERKVKGAPLTSGAGMSVRQKEKKKETAAVGCRGGGVSGLLGRQAER